MKTKLDDATGLIRRAYPQVLAAYETLMPGYTLQLTCVYRSPEEQYELYCKGRTKPGDIVTQIDGKTKLGAHNYFPARAIDVAVVGQDTGKTYWQESLYYPLVEIAKRFGLESGGSWVSFKDWPHLQVPDFRNYNELHVV